MAGRSLTGGHTPNEIYGFRQKNCAVGSSEENQNDYHRCEVAAVRWNAKGIVAANAVKETGMMVFGRQTKPKIGFS